LSPDQYVEYSCGKCGYILIRGRSQKCPRCGVWNRYTPPPLSTITDRKETVLAMSVYLVSALGLLVLVGGLARLVQTLEPWDLPATTKPFLIVPLILVAVGVIIHAVRTVWPSASAASDPRRPFVRFRDAGLNLWCLVVLALVVWCGVGYYLVRRR
jgi:phage FluMu protein Com